MRDTNKEKNLNRTLIAKCKQIKYRCSKKY